MNNRFGAGVTTGVAAAIVIGLAGYQVYLHAGVTPQTVLADRAHVKKLEYLERIIDEYYLDYKDEDELAEGLYTGLLYGLGDPYSVYYTAEEYQEENTSTEGAYVGIGILMQKDKDGGVRVVECYEGGPGELAGLKKDDIISAVDGEDITDTTASEVLDMIKYSGEESVKLTIQREGAKEALEITVPVSDVELPCVFHEMLDDGVGYMRITEFKGVTYKQYKEAFSDLKANGMKKLVVDLRNNPGGLLDSVCDVLGQILPKGRIVYTEDKYGNRKERKCDGEHPIDMPLAVLVNEGSASASEIFAGAVKDYGIGTVVGTTTYGKGVVQSTIPLEDGSAVKLTVANYFTPKGDNIHKVGIKPDIEVELDSVLLDSEEISLEDDDQLAEAIKVLDN